jgi:hypothetical protein
MAVVLVLGARPREHASWSGPKSMTIVAAAAKVLSVRPVMAMIGTFKASNDGSRRITSSVSPLWERISITSSRCTRPRSPWTASAGCRQWLRVPVDARVAMIFCPTRPALPIPDTITLPGQSKIHCTARQNSLSSRLATLARAWLSSSMICRA